MYPVLESTLFSFATPLSRNNWEREKYCLMLCGSTQINHESFSSHYPSLIWLKSVALTYFAHEFAMWTGLCRKGSFLLHTVSACVTQLDCRIYLQMFHQHSWEVGAVSWKFNLVYCQETLAPWVWDTVTGSNQYLPVWYSIIFVIFGGQRSHKSCQHLRKGT